MIPQGTRLRLPALEAPPFRGKPTIVELSGSWCTNCTHAQPVLLELYRRLHPAGLELVTVLYEFTDDAEQNRRQADEYRRVYGIVWPVVVIDGTVDHADEILPMEVEGLDLSGFPLIFFLGADGEVRGFHAGFPAPQAKEEFAEAVRGLQGAAAELTAPR